MKKTPKILIHSIVFSPDCVSTAYLYNDIASGFKESGYEVVVLTTTPHYNQVNSVLSEQPLRSKWFGLYFESSYKGMKVLHVPQKKFKTTTARIFAMFYWHVLSMILMLLQRKLDIILSTSPPLSIGLISSMAGKIKGAKTIYNIQEIYPDLLINHKEVRNPLTIYFLRVFERLVYSWNDALVTIDKVFYNIIKDRVKDVSKLRVIPNFVDTSIFKPIPEFELSFCLDKDLFPENNSLKLMYAGNIGYAQEWNILIRLAIGIKNYPVEFWVIGDGVMKEKLAQDIKKYDLGKIHLVPYQLRDKMPYLIAYADAHFILMNQKVEEQGFPSKIYTIMACGKPLIVSSGKNTPLFNFFKDLDCAFLLSSNGLEEKYNELKLLILDLLNNPDLLKNKGKSSAALIQNHYSNNVIIPKYIELANSLLSPHE